MAISTTVFLVCLLFTFSGLSFLQGVASLGINYGQLGNNLLPPEKVVDLLRSINITKARIYDTNPQVLKAFANSGIELTVTAENDLLTQLISPQVALEWINSHIKPYVPATKITGIAIGNEVDTTQLLENLVPSMISIQDALAQLGLDSYIKVFTPLSYAVLEESYPPSVGSFKSEFSGVMSKLLQFLSSTKAPFWINAYPYFAYQANSEEISLDYVLFNINPNSSKGLGVTDPVSKLQYDNMLYAQVDAVIYSIKALGFDNIEVKVAETGWPSKGDADETGASLENAAMYNGNLMRRQLANEGTPLRPNLEVYVFALFNENMKSSISERNFGLFQPEGTMAYNVGFSRLSPPSVISKAAAPMGYHQIWLRVIVHPLFIFCVLTLPT